MRRIELQSSKIISSNRVNEGAVMMYLELLARDVQGAVYDVLVANVRSHKHSDLFIGSASHIIIEGNHRSVAKALLSPKIELVELENDADVVEAKRLAMIGRGGRFARKEDSLQSIVVEALQSAKICNGVNTLMDPLEKTVEKLVHNKGIDIRTLPPFIKAQLRSKYR